MRVAVAGASGVIGRALLPELVERGHEVVGLVRSDAAAATVAALGGRTELVDVMDTSAVETALLAIRPEAVVSELTSLPRVMDPRRFTEAYEANDRVRGHGTANVLAAAVASGARRLVAQSVGFWYRPAPGLAVEGDPLDKWADDPIGSSVRVLETMEKGVFDAPLEGILLRYGLLYGPGTYYAPDGDIAARARKRQYPLIGRGQGVFSFVHVADAARATADALERASPGVYNVADDDPATFAEWLPAFAEAVGAPKPFRVPVVVAKLMSSAGVVSWADQARGVSAAKLKAEVGWAPRYRSWREGFRSGLG